MARRSSPLIMGDFWLDRRDDGRSDVWQIASYDQTTKRIRYRTTRVRDLEAAKHVIQRYFVNRMAGYDTIDEPPKPDPLDVPVLSALTRYWQDHGSKAISAAGIAYNLRAFIAFLQQDEVGEKCTFDDLAKDLWERFRNWRMKPHRFIVRWEGKLYHCRSRGISGPTFKRNLTDVKSALNHAVENRLVPYRNPIPRLPQEFQSRPRTRVLSMAEIGAMLGYAADDPPLRNWILLMLATGGRPEATSLMVPSEQYLPAYARLNLQPVRRPITTKRNPIVPVIPELAALIVDHEGPWILDGLRLYMLRRRWRTMMDILGFGPDVVTKTIRHTVASNLEWDGADEMEISILLGHARPRSQRPEYAHYSPRYLSSVVAPLRRMWTEAQAIACEWRAEFAVVVTNHGGKMITRRRAAAANRMMSSAVNTPISPRLLQAWMKDRGRLIDNIPPWSIFSGSATKVRSSHFIASHRSG